MALGSIRPVSAGAFFPTIRAPTLIALVVEEAKDAVVSGRNSNECSAPVDDYRPIAGYNFVVNQPARYCIESGVRLWLAGISDPISGQRHFRAAKPYHVVQMSPCLSGFGLRSRHRQCADAKPYILSGVFPGL
jgi:hypothetical protein